MGMWRRRSALGAPRTGRRLAIAIARRCSRRPSWIASSRSRAPVDPWRCQGCPRSQERRRLRAWIGPTSAFRCRCGRRRRRPRVGTGAGGRSTASIEQHNRNLNWHWYYSAQRLRRRRRTLAWLHPVLPRTSRPPPPSWQQLLPERPGSNINLFATHGTTRGSREAFVLRLGNLREWGFGDQGRTPACSANEQPVRATATAEPDTCTYAATNLISI